MIAQRAYHTSSAEETKELARKWAKNVKGGDLILLKGDLGTGKTTFTQGLCEALGVEEKTLVRSPSFTLINEYRAKDFIIRHADLYRVDGEEDLDTIGLFDSVLRDESILIIEWAEKLGADTPSEAIVITFAHEEGDIREIVISEERD